MVGTNGFTSSEWPVPLDAGQAMDYGTNSAALGNVFNVTVVGFVDVP